MCGIYGCIGGQAQQATPLLADMGRILHHRGPDEGGERCGWWGGIGMRRLSIIDVEGGSQPLSDPTGRFTIVYNGEVYNYLELRHELQRSGYSFSTQSDTEVILAGYVIWGEDVVNRLSGMFAFCIQDGFTGKAFFARDHIGKKPLYFWQHHGTLYFASEVKALAAHPHFASAIDVQALAHYLTLRHVPAPLSIFKGIVALPAGQLARFDGTSLAIAPYRSHSFETDFTGTEDEAADRLLELLRSAVKSRMLASDVPVGAYLSGGLDSSLITALAVEVSGKAIHTFSMGYTEEIAHKSDIPYARLMAGMLGTTHHELFISANDVLAELPNIVRCFDEPFAGTISPYFLTNLISKHVKVAVSGDGADELFGSYAAHRAAAVIEERRLGRGSSYGTFAARRDLIDACIGESDGLWRTRFMAFTDEEKRELMPLSRDLTPTSDYLEHFYCSSRGDLVNRTLDVETRALLPDGVLTYTDRLSMAHSVEVRAPFLDRTIVELAARLPGHFKVRTDGATKSVLRRAAARILPPEIVDRPKVGFVLPIDAWLGSRFYDLVETAISTASLSHGFFSRDILVRYIDDHRRGATDNTYKIWTVVMFQLWHQQFSALLHGNVI